jgi:nitrite reductase/ring-hydroxylating ferredoxin subunit
MIASMKKNRIIFFCFILTLVACKKDDINQQLGIPYVNVDRYILLNDPNSLSLNAVGGFLYVNAGSRGILVYHRAYEEYVAFDRHCTYNTSDACGKVSLDSTSNVILNCACCASKFSIIDGSVLNGPAINPLLQYQAQLSGPGTLHIYN